MVKLDLQERYVAIVDPKNVILKGGKESIERHKRYSDQLQIMSEVQGKVNLKIFVPHDEKSSQVYNSNDFISPIKVIKMIKFPMFIFKLMLIVHRDKKNINLLIAGDPWLAAIISLNLRKIINRKILVQTQVHADIGSESWKKLSIRNNLKYAISRYTLQASDSIRFVSNIQYRKCAKKMKIDPEKIFVSGTIYPLPINAPTKYLNSNKVNIGMIGRISKDRGLSEFLKIVRKLNYLELDFDIYIAGSGQEIKKFQKELQYTHLRGDVFFLGHIAGDELLNFWKKINFCIFTAPAESFGRGLREALANGTPIWSTKTSGFEQLQQSFKGKEVRYISSEMSDEILRDAFNESKDLKIEFDYKGYFMEEQQKDLIKLVGSFVMNRNSNA